MRSVIFPEICRYLDNESVELLISHLTIAYDKLHMMLGRSKELPTLEIHRVWMQNWFVLLLKRKKKNWVGSDAEKIFINELFFIEKKFRKIKIFSCCFELFPRKSFSTSVFTHLAPEKKVVERLKNRKHAIFEP